MSSNERVAPSGGAGGERFGTMIVRGAWMTRHAGAGPVDPREICSHRFRHERPALAVALLAMGGGTAAAYFLGSQQVALLVLFAILAQAIAVRFQIKALIGRAAEVTPAQFSTLHAIVRRGIEALDAPSTRVFVVQDPNPNAFSFGFMRPYGIYLTSALVEGLEDDELAAVVGHELGHIKFGHTRVLALFGGVDAQLGIPLLQMVIRAPFLWWMRCAELSADRAGIAFTGRVSKMISTLVKIAIGPRLYDQVRPDELARQADEFYRGPWAVVSQLQSSHPFLVSRIQQVIDFAGPPESGHDLNLARPDGLTMSGNRQPEVQPSAPPAYAAGSAPPTTGLAPVGPAAQPDPARRAAPVPRVKIGDAWLAVTSTRGDQQWFQLPGPWITVGRGPDNDLPVVDPKISFRHFGIGFEAGVYTLYDLNSRNGILLNGQRVREAALRNGDEIRAGDSAFTFSVIAS